MKFTRRFILGIAGILLLALAFWQMGPGAETGLQTVRTEVNDSPVLFIGPAGRMDGSRPLVLIGHGFAGSTALMRSFALPLAHAGYVTALWDFNGHGANPNPMRSSANLNATAEAVLAKAEALSLFAPGQVAILGHSMGSGVALRFGQEHPETAATIAVSPVGVGATPDLPRNLLLMAGENETNFVRNAEKLLDQAGGSGGDMAAGTARKLVIIPLVEHISILFHDQSHAETRAWLDAAFGEQAEAQNRPSRVIAWYGFGILGALLAAVALAPATPFTSMISQPLWRRIAALAVGALTATFVLVVLDRLGVNLSGFLGVLVGGYLVVWFALAGVIALVVLQTGKDSLRFSGSPPFLAALVVFAFLWVGVGLLGSQVWVAWMLIPARLLRWAVGAVGFLPWMLAVGLAVAPTQGWGRAGWWLVSSLMVVAALFAAMMFGSGLGFLILILPLFPVMLGFHALAAGRQGSAWAFALSGAAFLSWMVMAVFPLQ